MDNDKWPNHFYGWRYKDMKILADALKGLKTTETIPLIDYVFKTLNDDDKYYIETYNKCGRIFYDKDYKRVGECSNHPKYGLISIYKNSSCNLGEDFYCSDCAKYLLDKNKKSMRARKYNTKYALINLTGIMDINYHIEMIKLDERSIFSNIFQYKEIKHLIVDENEL